MFQPPTCLGVLCWTHFRPFLFVLYRIVPNWKCNLTSAKYGQYFPRTPGHALITTALVTPAHLYQGTLLAHAQLASSDSHIILAELTSSQPHGLQLCSHRGLTHPTTQPCILSLMNCRRSLPVHSSGLFISGRYLCPEVRAVWWWLQSQCRYYYVIVLLYIPSPLLGHS